MKAIILYTFLILSYNLTSGQTCLPNGTFTNACNGVLTGPNGQCPTWTDICGGGWVRSNGSPQMIYYIDGNNSGFYAFMWSKSWLYNGTQSNEGEGMFTNYSFSPNHTYDVKIRISTSNANGSVLVYAANGLTQSTYFGNCGDQLPNISQKQLIGSYTGFTNGWLTINLPSFTPTTNYSQIWIYPLGAPTNVQYTLGVLYVSTCLSCNDIITYNNGVIPSGESRAGIINVGSSAGSGGVPPVTVNSNLATNLIAGNEINLLPEFNATVSAGSFSATISPCNSAPSSRIYLDSLNIELYQSNEGAEIGGTKRPSEILAEKELAEIEKINLYPNPSKGKVFINIEDTNYGAGTIEVYGADGKIFQKKEIAYNMKTISVDLSNYNSGFYFIKLSNKRFIKTYKVLLGK